MLGIVGAFIGGEEAERRGEQAADLFKVARTCGSQERFQFGEGQFDRIKVGTVGREKSQEGTGLLNRRAHLGLLVGRQIVEHDDVAWAQCGHQDLLDVGAEGSGVHGSIEHGCRGQLGRAERRDDRVRLPVAARRVVANARPAKAASVAA